MEKLISIAIACVFLLSSFTISTALGNSNTVLDNETIYVSKDFNVSTPGWGVIHFDNIQNAIDTASANDTIFVYNGTYNHQISIFKEGITLIGEDKHTTIIDGTNLDEYVLLGIYSKNNVTIKGFTIKNSEEIGLNMEHSDNCLITDNIFENFGFYAILFFIGANNNTISNNIFKNNNLAILMLFSRYNNISTNDFINNKRNIKFRNSYYNKWVNNYWGRSRLFPKVIFGHLSIPVYTGASKPEHIHIPLFNIDWQPAKQPNNN